MAMYGMHPIAIYLDSLQLQLRNLDTSTQTLEESENLVRKREWAKKGLDIYSDY